MPVDRPSIPEASDAEDGSERVREEATAQQEELPEIENSSDVESGEDESPKPQRSARRTATRPARRPKGPSPAQQSSRNEALATAISVKAHLPNCAIGIVEFLSFFPVHTQWPEAGLRPYRNEWRHTDVAKVQLHARGTLTKDAYRKRVDALKHQILTNGRAVFNDGTFTPTTHPHLMTAVTTYDASNYSSGENISRILYDASLVDIAEGVVNWPTGEDRGIVTQCIEYAFQNDLDQYTTADIPRIAQQMGFAAPGEASRADWDKRALRRARQIAHP